MSNTVIRVEPAQKKSNLRRLIFFSVISIFILLTTTSCKEDFARAASAFIHKPTAVPRPPANQIFILKHGETILHNYPVQLIYANDNEVYESTTDVNGRVIFPIPPDRSGQAANIKLLDNDRDQLCHWHVIIGDDAYSQLNMSTDTANIIEPGNETIAQVTEPRPEPVLDAVAPQPTALPEYTESFSQNSNPWWLTSDRVHQIETAVVSEQLRYNIIFGGESRQLVLSEIPYGASPANYTFSADVTMQTPPMRGTVAISLIFGRTLTGDSFYAARFYPQTRTYELSRYENGERRLAPVQSGTIDPSIFHGDVGETNTYEIEVYQRIVILRINGYEIGRSDLATHPQTHSFAFALDGDPNESTSLVFDNITIIPATP